MGKRSRKVPGSRPTAPSPPTALTVGEERWRRSDTAWAAAVCAVAFGVFAATVCPTIYTSGAGENVTAVATLGVPHPPGFPLFCLFGKLFTTIVPAGEMAYRVNLFSSACGGAAAAVLASILRLVLGRGAWPAAASAGLLFAFSRTFWSQAVIAEVYTLNALVLALVVLDLVRWERGASLAHAGLAFGLGLAVHPLQVLFLPGWLLWIVISPRRASLTPRAIAGTAGLVALGVSLHLYAPIRSWADPTLDWGDPGASIESLVAYATAAQYRGRMFGLSASEVVANAGRAVRQLGWELTPWLLPLPLVGAWRLARTQGRLLAATAVGAVLTFVYAVNYDIPWEIEVYFIPIALVMALSTGAALAWAVPAWPRSAVLPLLALVPLLTHWAANDRSRHRIVRAFGEDILATCPAGAVLVTPATDASFALLYLTAVEGRRADVDIWVRDVEGLRPLGEAATPEVRPISYRDLVALAGPRPVLHVERPTSDLLPGHRPAALGLLHVLVGRDAPLPPPRSFARYALEAIASSPPDVHLDDRSRVILASYLFAKGDTEVQAGRKDAGRALYARAASLGPDVAEIQSELGGRLADLGDRAGAIEALRRNLALREEDGVVHNRLGRLLVEAGRLDEAEVELRRALELSPDLAIARSNLGGLLGMKGDVAGALRELEAAVRLDPGSTHARNNLGRAALLSGDPTRARREWEASLALDPGQDDVRRQVAALPPG